METLKILYAGTPEIAVPSLETLHRNFRIVGVLTNPDRPSGRGKRKVASPVKRRAEELGLTVLQPEKLNAPARKRIAELQPDLLVVVAYGKIFGPKFLSLFSRGGVNLHPSLLPLYRGCAPLTAAILNGDAETGITIQKLALEMDSGDILLQEAFPLTGTETTASLTRYCADRGADMLSRTVRRISEGSEQATVQKEALATYCGMIEKEAGRIRWTEPAARIERMVRAYNPWPTAYSSLEGRKLSLLESSVAKTASPKDDAPGTVIGVDNRAGILIQTGQETLAVTKLQLATKKAMHWKNFINGYKDLTGIVLGAEE